MASQRNLIRLDVKITIAPRTLLAFKTNFRCPNAYPPIDTPCFANFCPNTLVFCAYGTMHNSALIASFRHGVGTQRPYSSHKLSVV